MQKLIIEIEGVTKPLDNLQIAGILQGLSESFHQRTSEVPVHRMLFTVDGDEALFIRLETYLTEA